MVDLTQIRSAFNATAEAGLRWWGRELAAIMPAPIGSWLASDRDRIVVEVNGGRASVFAARGGASAGHMLVAGDIATVSAFLAAEGLRLVRLRPLVLRVPLARCLVRNVTMPLQALERADAVLTIDLERATPFRRQEVFSGHLPSAVKDSIAEVRHIILKRDAIGALLATLEHARMPVAGVEPISDSGEVLPVLLRAAGQADARTSIARLLDRTVAALTLAFVVTAACALAVSVWHERAVLSDAERQLSALQKQAQQLRQALTSEERALVDAAAARHRKFEEPSVVAIIEELTRLLPDSAFISELQIADGFIVIDGMARQAADLVSLLTSAQRFSEVTFAAPVTRDPGRNLERFRIRMKLGNVSIGR